ncbi:MAG: hypothetical protein RSD44_01780 [Akkermansia sp.]
MKNKYFRVILITLTFMGIPSSWAIPAEVFMTDGYKLHGDIISIDSQHTIIKHPEANPSLSIKNTAIQSITIYSEFGTPQPYHDKIYLADTPSDIIPCTIKSIDHQGIHFSSFFGENTQLPLDHISGVRLSKSDRFINLLPTPFTFDKTWLHYDNPKIASAYLASLRPVTKDNKTSYTLASHIFLSKDVGLNPIAFNFEVSLPAEKQKSLSVSFTFGGNSKDILLIGNNTPLPEARAITILTITNTTCSLFIVEKNSRAKMILQAPIPLQQIPCTIKLTAHSLSQGKITYELTSTGREPIHYTLNSTKDIQPEGSYFAIQNNLFGTKDCENPIISDLHLSTQAPIPSEPPNRSPQFDVLKMTNGQSLTGKLISLKIKDKKLSFLIQGQKEPSEFISDQVTFILLKQSQSANNADTPTYEDNTVYLKNGCNWNGKIISLNTKRLIIKHPTLGKTSIPFNLIRSIEFHHQAPPIRSLP